MLRKDSDQRSLNIVVEGWPRIGRLAGIVALATALATGLSACSSTEDEEYSDEEMVDEEGGSENAANANDVNGGDEEVADNGGAVNNIPTEEGTNGEFGNLGGEATAGENYPSVDDTTAIDSEQGIQTVDTAPDASVPGSMPESSPGISGNIGSGLPAGTVGVVYVSGSRAAIYDAPNGREVGRLASGDYILASAEGEWAKTHDGRYIRSGDLQTKPVGRVRVQSRWKRSRNQ